MRAREIAERATMGTYWLSELCLYETLAVDCKPGSCPTLPFANHRRRMVRLLPPTLSIFTV